MNGNLTGEQGPTWGQEDAVRNNGGIIIAQVKQVAAGSETRGAVCTGDYIVDCAGTNNDTNA